MNATGAAHLATNGTTTFPVAPVDASEDQRNDARVKTSLAGTISDKGTTVDCLVRDLSEGGAKIEIDPAFPLAPAFDLVIAEIRTQFHCELRWRYARAVGVKFVSSKPMADAEDHPTREELLAENAELKNKLAQLTQQIAAVAVLGASEASAPRAETRASTEKRASTKTGEKPKKTAAPRRPRAAAASKVADPAI